MAALTALNQPAKIAEIVAALLPWFAAQARDLPWRRDGSAYGVWVSEIMLQQTQVKTVIPYWERWMAELPDVTAVARAHPDRLHQLWAGLGYYTRVRNLQKAAQVIVERHGGVFPERYEEILALPGIGRYTAGAVGSIAFGQPVPIVDGNVIRVLTRLFGIAENPRDKAVNQRLWELATDLVRAAKGHCSALNQSLMELGALVCSPRQPQCTACPVRQQCVARRTGRVDQLPNLAPRPSASARTFVAFAAEHRGRWLVRQRPAGVVNAHLWEFPNVETTGEESETHTAARELLGVEPAQLVPLPVVRHSITRYRITLQGYRVRLTRRPAGATGTWCTAAELAQLAFPSAHKRLASAALKSILLDR